MAIHTGPVRPIKYVELTTAAVGLLTAVISLGFAFGTAQAKQSADQRTAVAEGANSRSRERVQELETRLAQAQEELDGLRSTTPAAPAPDPEPAADSTPPTTTAGVFREGDATVARGQGIDLEAPPSDAQWGTFTGEHDLLWGRYCTTADVCLASGAKAVVVDDAATVATCRSATGYGDESIKGTKLRNGLAVCVRTGDGRFSLVRVTKYSGTESPLVVHVVTLKNEKD
jgi:hypothetical protein